MTKLDSLITLLVSNQASEAEGGFASLCGSIICRHVSCNDCPLDSLANMKELIEELEDKNV